jgi:hypothetical protein
MGHNDQMEHYAERIEAPVIECDIKIIHDDENFVNK